MLDAGQGPASLSCPGDGDLVWPGLAWGSPRAGRGKYRGMRAGLAGCE